MGRPLLFLSLAFLAALLYALLIPFSVGGGYTFTPRYAASLEAGTLTPLYPGTEAEEPPETLLSHSEEYLAYLDLRNRQIRLTRRRAYGIAAVPWGFINYTEAPGNLLFQSTYGQPLFSLLREGYPFGRGGRLFLLHADGYTISEHGEDGQTLWTTGGLTPVTAFDAASTVSAVGFLSGALYVNGGDREWEGVSLPDAQIQVVYDLSLSQDGQSLLVRSGLEPQSLSLYDLSGEQEVLLWVQEPDTPSIRSEALSLLSPTTVAVQLAEAIELRSRETGELIRRIEETRLGDSAYFENLSLGAYVAAGEGHSELVVFDGENRPIYRGSRLPEGLRLFQEGNLLILAVEDRVSIVEVGL